MDRILRVSGSSHEWESGSRFNNAKTAAEGALVINRYDLGYYDKRGREEVSHVETDASADQSVWSF